MYSAYDSPKSTTDQPWPERSRFHNRAWMVIVLAFTLVFLGMLIRNNYTAPNERLDPVEQGTLGQQQPQAN